MNVLKRALSREFALQLCGRKALELVDAVCPLCARCGCETEATGYDYEYITCNNEFKLIKCKRCDLIYLSPRPRNEDFKITYPPNYYAFDARSRAKTFTERVRHYIERRKVKTLIKYLPTAPRILDIGCGDGRFLSVFKESLPKARLFGIDIDGGAIKAARSNGIEAVLAMAEDYEGDAESLDMILILQVLEHVTNPLEILSRIRRMLKPGGIAVIETPNYKTTDHSLFRRSLWGGYHIPRHMTLFSAFSLSKMSKQAGLVPLKTSYMINPIFWTLTVNNFLTRDGWPKYIRRRFSDRDFHPFILAIFTLIDSISFLVTGKTSNIQLIAQKPK